MSCQCVLGQHFGFYGHLERTPHPKPLADVVDVAEAKAWRGCCRGCAPRRCRPSTWPGGAWPLRSWRACSAWPRPAPPGDRRDAKNLRKVFSGFEITCGKGCFEQMLSYTCGRLWFWCNMLTDACGRLCFCCKLLTGICVRGRGLEQVLTDPLSVPLDIPLAVLGERYNLGPIESQFPSSGVMFKEHCKVSPARGPVSEAGCGNACREGLPGIWKDLTRGSCRGQIETSGVQTTCGKLMSIIPPSH